MSQHKCLVGATGVYALALLGLTFLQPGPALAVAVVFVVGLVTVGAFGFPFMKLLDERRAHEATIGMVQSEPGAL